MKNYVQLYLYKIMTLKDRQIFSHLEGKLSLPQLFFNMAVDHAKIHPRKAKDCEKCALIFSVTPSTIGTRVKKEEYVPLIHNPNIPDKRINYEAINAQREEDINKLLESRAKKKVLSLTFTRSKK